MLIFIVPIIRCRTGGGQSIDDKRQINCNGKSTFLHKWEKHCSPDWKQCFSPFKRALLFYFFPFFAQNAENANAVVATAQAPQDEYTKIEVKDLPAAVTEALGKAYPESTIKEASVTTKEEGKFYKVVVTQKDGTDVTVVLNEKGEEVK